MAEQNGRYRVSWEVIATVVAWLVGGLLAYGALNARIQVLEDRYDRLVRDIGEIKQDVKVLIQRGTP
jgi:hypothetical protein